MTNRIKCIVLKKIAYKDTSLLITSLSEEYGRVDFILRGARRITSKSSSSADLFREISIPFRENNGLMTIYKTELISQFDAIAANTDAFMEACEICRFLIRNTRPSIQTPLSYKALKTALSRLSLGTCRDCLVLLKLVFLEEQGFLPEVDSARGGGGGMLLKLLAAGRGDAPYPKLDDTYINEISLWTDRLCRYHDLI